MMVTRKVKVQHEVETIVLDESEVVRGNDDYHTHLIKSTAQRIIELSNVKWCERLAEVEGKIYSMRVSRPNFPALEPTFIILIDTDMVIVK